MKHLLIVSYFWPPSGKASAHWPFAMARYLNDLGWQSTILTVDEDTFSPRDGSDAVTSPGRVVRSPGIEPFDLYRRFLGKKRGTPLQAADSISLENPDLRHRVSIWIRMNLFVPDARVGWYWSARRTAKRDLADQRFDAVLSVGPPHTGLLVGRALARQRGIPHVPVFIDPWVDIVYYRSFKRNPLTEAVDRSLERSVIEDAAHVVFVNQTMKQDFCSRYPSALDRSSVLYWGYDDAPFKGFVPQPPSNGPVLLHAGNIFDYQHPRQLWKTIKKLNAEGRGIRLEFVGSVGPQIRAAIDAEGLSEATSYAGFLPYSEMIKRLERASYLLVCASEPRHVPGKLFEYLRSGKPILAFGDDNTEVASILAETRAGRLFRYDSSAEEFFSTAWSDRPVSNEVRAFDRRSIAQGLAQVLDRLASSA